LFNEFPKKVLSFGSKNYASILLQYDSGIIANLNLSRINHCKERTFCICGEKGMLLWDDLKPDNKLKLINKDISFPKVDSYQPLIMSCEDFINRCQTKNFKDHKLSLEISKIFQKL